MMETVQLHTNPRQMVVLWQPQMVYKEECMIKWTQSLFSNLLFENHEERGKGGLKEGTILEEERKGEGRGKDRQREKRRGEAKCKEFYYAAFPVVTANIFSFCYVPEIILRVKCFINPYSFINWCHYHPPNTGGRPPQSCYLSMS